MEKIPEKCEKMEERKIIGYKFKDQKYRKAAIQICFTQTFEDHFLDSIPGSCIAFFPSSGCFDKLTEAGVMHWFEPVYPKFKVGPFLFM